MSGVLPINGIPGAMQSGVAGIQRATKNLEHDASTVARAVNVDAPDTLGALVDSKQQLLYTKAAAKIISASDEMLQTLIDIRA